MKTKIDITPSVRGGFNAQDPEFRILLMMSVPMARALQVALAHSSKAYSSDAIACIESCLAQAIQKESEAGK